jgi:hypothetical protein
MNSPALFATALTFVALSAAPVAAQDLTGTWEISSETQRGPQNLTLELVQDGSALTGTVTLTMGGRRGGGGGGGGERTMEISHGEVDGMSFSFLYTISFGERSISQSYSGTFEGDAMEGTIEGGRGGGRPFTGERGG